MTPEIFLFQALFNRGAAQQCSEYKGACKWGTHTFCKYNTTGFAKRCDDVRASGVSEEDQREILDAFNEVRRKVSRGDYKKYGLPAASSPIGNLTWNSEAAAIAQRLANQCQLAQDECRNLKDGTYAGQSVAIYGGGKDWKLMITGSLFGDQLNSVKATLDGLYLANVYGGAGHLTQAIWNKTKSVGCGYTEFKKSNEQYVRQLYVCNYVPGGNVQGEEVYKAQRLENTTVGNSGTIYHGTGTTLSPILLLSGRRGSSLELISVLTFPDALATSQNYVI